MVRKSCPSEEDFWSRMLEAMQEMPEARLSVDDLMRMRNIIRRKLWLDRAIDEDGEDSGLVDSLVQAIMQYNADDDAAQIPPEERVPILLYINCEGGDIFSGMHLIDVIRCSRTPIYTIVQGIAMSMAFHVAIVGHKRFAMQNSSFLVHDGEVRIGNSMSKTDDFIKFNKMFQERLNSMVTERTKITEETLKAKEREDWYMFADQALLLGVVDEIITPERGLNEII